MKKASIHAASAAASVALSAYSSKVLSFHQIEAPRFQMEEDKTRAAKFEPRFDGLRFIETLVTAHR